MGATLFLFSSTTTVGIVRREKKEEEKKVPPANMLSTPNSLSISLLFSHSSPRSSRRTLGLEPFGAGEEEERQKGGARRRERERKKLERLFSFRRAANRRNAIEQRNKKINPNTRLPARFPARPRPNAT